MDKPLGRSYLLFIFIMWFKHILCHWV